MGLQIAVVARGVGLHGVGGMEQHTDRLIQTLERQGHRVTLVTTRIPGAHPPSEAMVVVPHTRANRTGLAWRRQLVGCLQRLHMRQPLDLVISQSTAANPALGWLRHHQIATVYILHGSAWEAAEALKGRRDPKSWARRIKALAAWRQNVRLLPQVPRLVAISPSLASSFTHHLALQPGQLITLANPVSDIFVVPPPEVKSAARQANPATWIIGYAGRLTREKGIPLLLHWVLHRPQTLLALAGAGTLEPQIRVASQKAPIYFAGRLEESALAHFYAGLDVFALPTRYFEGLPLAMLEAMATGLPIVAFATGGIADWFARAPEPFGIAVPPGDDAAFEAALTTLQDDPENAFNLGQAGARWVASLRWDPWVQALLGFALGPKTS